MLDLITEIAQETHILSLNAAIEAAAAGDHGRRFSVVAEEVRRLAQRSQESVESVRNLLDEFAGSIRTTVVATDEGSKEAGRVLERARAAASAIEDLRGASSDTARVAREISLATQQQNAASDEVVLTLKEVSQVVQRMADGLKHFTETADRLNRLGLIIQMLAQSFHLDSPHSLKHTAELWAREVRRRLGNWEAIERLLEDLVHRQGFVECLYFYDGRRGQTALVVNRQIVGDRDVPGAVRTGEGFSERPWYKSAVREGHTILTPLFNSLFSGRPIFTAATPIYDQGELEGRARPGRQRRQLDQDLTPERSWTRSSPISSPSSSRKRATGWSGWRPASRGWRSDPQSVVEAKRELHTLKGAGRMMRIGALAELCHAAEEVLHAARPGMIPLLTRVVDELSVAGRVGLARRRSRRSTPSWSPCSTPR